MSEHRSMFNEATRVQMSALVHLTRLGYIYYGKITEDMAGGSPMSELKKKINYTVVCVNEFANRFNIASKEAFVYLYDHKGIEFIKEHYDIEHTLSLDDAVDDLAMVCRNNGGAY